MSKLHRAMSLMNGKPLLGAALYDPLWVSSVKSVGDFAVVLVGFVLLTAWGIPPLIVVILAACAGILVN